MHSVSVNNQMKNIRVVFVIHENERQIYLNIYSNGEFYFDESICLQNIESSHQIFDEICLIIAKQLNEYSWNKLRSFKFLRTILISDKISATNFDDKKRIMTFSSKEILSQILQEKFQINQNNPFVYNLYYSIENYQQSARFIWYQLLIDILEQMPDNQQIEKEIEDKYRPNVDCQSDLLNYAFQTENFELIYFYRKHILDLHSNIQKSTNKNQQILAFHKQLMSKKELEELKTHRHGILSLDNFLFISTEDNRDKFEYDSHFHEHIQWQIPCRVNKKNIIDIHSIFRIQTIDFDKETKFSIIKLSIDENWKEDFDINDLRIDFGRILWKYLDNFTQANFYFHVLLQISDMNRKEIHLQLGQMNTQRNEYDLALNSYQLALDFCEENSLEQLEILVYLKNIYQTKKNTEKTLEYLIRIYNIEEQIFSINDVRCLEHFEEIFCLFKTLEQFDHAIDFYRMKSPQFESNSNNQIQLTRIYTLLATIFEDRNPKQADQFYQQAVSLLQINPQESIYIQSLSTMISFYWKCRMFDRAVVFQMKLLDYRQRNPVHKPLDLAYALRDLARLYRVMNKLTEALDYFQQSLNILKKHFAFEQSKDIKLIQQEIFDLEEILKSLSSTANEDYNYRRQSNAHKNFLPLSPADFKTTVQRTIEKKKQQQPSTICNIL